MDALARAGFSNGGNCAPIPATYLSLTGIRGVAALWVLSFHVLSVAKGMNPGMFPGDLVFIRDGWVGVDLFFILSGFVLMHAHRDDFDGRVSEDVRRFLTARFWRIYPLNFAVLLLVAGLVLLNPSFATAFRAQGDGNLSLPAFLRTATLSGSWLFPGSGEWNEPTWSLSAEVLGYLVFPTLAGLALRVNDRSRAMTLGAYGIAAVLAFQAATGSLGVNVITGLDPIIRMFGMFACGVMLYRLRQLAPEPWVTKATDLSCGAVISLATLTLLPGGVALMPICFAVLIFSLSLDEQGAIGRVLSARVVLWLGRISFPLYLVHLMPLRFFNHAFTQSSAGGPALYIVGLLLTLAAIFGLAALLHRYVERPCARVAHMARHMPQDPANRAAANR